MKAYSETSMYYIHRYLTGENLHKDSPHPTWDILINILKDRALYKDECDIYTKSDPNITAPKFEIYAIPMIDHPAFNIVLRFNSSEILFNRMIDLVNSRFMEKKIAEAITVMKNREGCENDPYGIVMIDEAFDNPYANTDSKNPFKLVAQLYDNSVMVLTNAQSHQFSIEVHAYDMYSDFSLETVRAEQHARDLINNCKDNNQQIGDYGAIAMITVRYIYMYLMFIADGHRRNNLVDFTPCGESC